jgi:hypothetical protein
MLGDHPPAPGRPRRVRHGDAASRSQPLVCVRVYARSKKESLSTQAFTFRFRAEEETLRGGDQRREKKRNKDYYYDYYLATNGTTTYTTTTRLAQLLVLVVRD